MLVNPWKVSTFVLAGALSFASIPEAEADGKTQPHMHSALQYLDAAAAQLSKATHDKGGHRAAALKLTNDAIAQVKKGIAFDKKH